MWAWLVGTPKISSVPRSQCHRLVLELKGIPKRLTQSSIRLQLIHLTGLPEPAFAWRVFGGKAEVWYWDDAKLDAGATGTMPCPEGLLRPSEPDGLALLRCGQGFEAISRRQGQTERTRWFSAVPDHGQWQQFVRDAGFDPDQFPLPDTKSLALSPLPEPGWVIHTTLIKPLSRKTWALLAGALLVGAVIFGMLSYTIKLAWDISTLRQEWSALSVQSAQTLQIQREMESLRRPLDKVVSLQPKTLQLKLMAQLAEAGIFDESKKVSLQDWEYRNGRFRLQFVVPVEGFALGAFLESIEKLGIFTNVRLLSGTPPNVVALQAVLAGEKP